MITDGQERVPTYYTELPEGCPLSGREWEILKCIAKGLTAKQIAALKGLTYSAVRTHLCNAYRKLNVVNASTAVARVIAAGWLYELPSKLPDEGPLSPLLKAYLAEWEQRIHDWRDDEIVEHKRLTMTLLLGVYVEEKRIVLGRRQGHLGLELPRELLPGL